MYERYKDTWSYGQLIILYVSILIGKHECYVLKNNIVTVLVTSLVLSAFRVMKESQIECTIAAIRKPCKLE